MAGATRIATISRIAASHSLSAHPRASPTLLSALHRPHLSRTPPNTHAVLLLRHASTTASQARSGATRLKNFIYGTSISLFLVLGYFYLTDTRASAHRYIIPRALRALFPEAERAHEVGTSSLKTLYSFGLHPRERGDPDAQGDLAIEVFGHTLKNPIGTSAGIDKNADVPDPLLALGTAVVEVGGVVPNPQDGNPRPRVFRIPSQNALINRYGLNSEGAEFVAMRLRERLRNFAYHMGYGIGEEAETAVLDGAAGVPPGSLANGSLLAVQVAKNKSTPEQDIDAVRRDYVFCVDQLARYADIIVVNVSSPNTPGLRSLQRAEPLKHILSGVVDAAKATDRKAKPAVMVKVSPDEDSEEQVAGIVEAVWDSGVDGVIVGNTTKKRPDPLPAGYALPAREASLLLEQGGYSGPQMFEQTLALVKRYRKALDQGPRSFSAPQASRAPPKKEQQGPPKPVSGHTTGDNVHSSTPASPQTPKANDASTAQEEPQPLIKLPERHSSFSNGPSGPGEPAPSSAAAAAAATDTTEVMSTQDPEQTPLPEQDPVPEAPARQPRNQHPFDQPQKVIFATGGIANGRQALEVLNAGASVAMVYTALVYGGVGTVSRIKQEMREEIRNGGGGGGKKEVS